MLNCRHIRKAMRPALFSAIVLTFACVSDAQADGIERTGLILRVALPVAAGGLSLFREDYDGVLQLGASELASIGTSYLLQSVVKERRPDGSDMRSFPSDSTAVAFSAATYLERRYGWDYGLPAYAAASFVAYSRVEANKHHWGDVAAGALIGWGASMITTLPYLGNLGVSVATGYRETALGFDARMTW